MISTEKFKPTMPGTKPKALDVISISCYLTLFPGSKNPANRYYQVFTPCFL